MIQIIIRTLKQHVQEIMKIVIVVNHDVNTSNVVDNR
jgi:hypothetical protein